MGTGGRGRASALLGPLTLLLVLAAVASIGLRGSRPPTGDQTDLVDSAALDTPVVATGTVVDEDGEPLVGVPVVLVAWPSYTTGSDRGHGGSLALDEDIAVARTDDEGGFALRVEDPDSLVSAAGGPDGFLDIGLRALDPRAQASTSVTVQVVQDGDGGYTLRQGNGPVTVALGPEAAEPDDDARVITAWVE